jgi:anionic cell wall polymer biosynthesis LytR-Cps2A-Psr (LCP) family protein
MKTTRILTLALILLLALPLAGCGLLSRPLGAELQLTQPPAAAPAEPQSVSVQPQVTQAPALVVPTPQPVQTEPVEAAPVETEAVAAPPACNAQGQIELLILGQASTETPGQRGADAIRLVHIDYDQPTLRNLTLPPDLLAGENTLTQAYWLALQSAQGEDPARHQQATQALAQVLLDNYGYTPDHYIDLNQLAFVDIIDSLGGIQIDVPQAITDVPPGWYTFQPGPQTLTGDQVRDYVRLLNPTNKAYTSEWDRFTRQNQVIFAALTAALDPANWEQLPALVLSTRDLLVTDLSLDQLLDLACILKTTGDQAQYLELPLQNAATDDQGRIIADPALVRSLIADLQK